MDDSGPYHSVMEEDFAADILIDAALDRATAESGDAIITLPDGTRYSALLMTVRAIQRAMDADRISGQSLHGAYFHAPDLVVLREGGVQSMVETIRDIIVSDQISALPSISPSGGLLPPEM